MGTAEDAGGPLGLRISLLLTASLTDTKKFSVPVTGH